MRLFILVCALCCAVSALSSEAHARQGSRASTAAYPPSTAIKSIVWHWDTLNQAATGSDLWPVTWCADGSLLAAWGDGGGFGGSDQDGRVAMGIARIDGPPERITGANVNGGKNPEHPASFPDKGKADGLLAVGSTLYAWVNMQNGEYPNVDVRLAWSDDAGAAWHLAPWSFPRGAGSFKPATFLNFGKGYAGVPGNLKGYVFFYGTRQGDETHTFMGRVPQDKVRDRSAYQFLAGFIGGRPAWGPDVLECKVCQGFTGDVTVSYVPALRRYLAAGFHAGPGRLGVLDAPEPWGPWTTVAWYEDWGGMGIEGEGLTCSFPQKWMSGDGRTLWCVFSVYGRGAQHGIHGHDRFNSVKVTLNTAH